MLSRAIAINPPKAEQFIEIQVDVPQPGPWDLLVEVKAFSINPVDTKVRDNARRNGLKDNKILGWDGCGVVIATGSKVAHFKPGNEVWYAGDITRPGSNATHQLVDSRIAALKPRTLTPVQAAAMPLTALTAWEGLFEKLMIQNAESGKTLLIIGGAGGVGSLAISLAALRSKVKVIATASRAESAAWCRERGVDLVVDYHNLKQELEQADIKQIDYIFCVNNIDQHWLAICDLIAPFGHICSVVKNLQPLEMEALKNKSASLHWELMFTRSLYQTVDIEQQGNILHEIANIVDSGQLQSSLTMHWNGLTVANIEAAHQQLLSGHMKGKLVIEL